MMKKLAALALVAVTSTAGIASVAPPQSTAQAAAAERAAAEKLARAEANAKSLIKAVDALRETALSIKRADGSGLQYAKADLAKAKQMLKSATREFAEIGRRMAQDQYPKTYIEDGRDALIDALEFTLDDATKAQETEASNDRARARDTRSKSPDKLVEPVPSSSVLIKRAATLAKAVIRMATAGNESPSE